MKSLNQISWNGGKGNKTMKSGDEAYMNLALAEAEKALELGEVPIGAVAVCRGEVITRSHNLREAFKDPTAHAEMLVFRQAARQLGRWRLTGITLYVTLEPCAMCAGAAVLSRVDRLVYGCEDSRAGACGSVFDIVREPRLNHRVELVSGILEEDCRSILKSFFTNRRRENGATEEQIAFSRLC